MPRSALSFALRYAAFVGAAAFSAAACHRVDELPAPGAGASVHVAEVRAPEAQAPTGATTTSAALAGRCIFPTPAEAPPTPMPAERCPPDPNPHALATAAVDFPQAEKGRTRLTAEMAVDEDERTRGLMFRTRMAEEHGMLFDMKERTEHSFWMRNTCLPLDMMFIDDDGLIVGIVENVPTLNERSRSVPCPSTYVLEVNAGWSRRHGVRAGQKVILPR
jgi:uncharacterized membrane protein (UPF0127 family)